MTTSARTACSTKPAAKPAPPKPTTRVTRVRQVQTLARGRDEMAGSTRVSSTGGEMFADLRFTPEEAKNLKVRAQLMDEVRRLIVARGLTQAQAGALLGVAQPRISDLMRGKIGLFTIDALVNMLAHAGVGVSVAITSTVT